LETPTPGQPPPADHRNRFELSRHGHRQRWIVASDLESLWFRSNDCRKACTQIDLYYTR
jgi:hypothetical protein